MGEYLRNVALTQYNKSEDFVFVSERTVHAKAFYCSITDEVERVQFSVNGSLMGNCVFARDKVGETRRFIAFRILALS